MKRFLINIIGFTVLLFIITKCFGKIISIGLRKNETRLFYNLTKINQGKINSDLIINGSSKALVQVNPFIIDSILGVNSYNLGLDGNPFIPQNAEYKLYRLKNTKPKVIIQIVSNGTLRSLEYGFKNPVKFAPYMDIPEVKKQMKLTNSFSNLDYFIPLLMYSSKPFEVITGTLSFFNINLFKSFNKKGYSPKNKPWNEESDENIKIPLDTTNLTYKNQLKKINEFTSLDKISCENFESFLSQCKKEDILVFLVYPPIYTEFSYTIKNIDYYKKVAKKYNAFFLNYSKDSEIAINKNFFYNSQHLNIKGATIFTEKLSEDIKAQTINKLNKLNKLNK